MNPTAQSRKPTESGSGTTMTILLNAQEMLKLITTIQTEKTKFAALKMKYFGIYTSN